ncbi:DUF1391 domain-containing protein [Salmonella enterica subsp. enterica serovar Oranienburg]|nr:DUF1391 domain-containing protein [Salmonella enterica subsp. enterica serovar Oranienburg]
MKTIDLNNNESLVSGVFPNHNGTFTIGLKKCSSYWTSGTTKLKSSRTLLIRRSDYSSQRCSLRGRS